MQCLPKISTSNHSRGRDSNKLSTNYSNLTRAEAASPASLHGRVCHQAEIAARTGKHKENSSDRVCLKSAQLPCLIMIEYMPKTCTSTLPHVMTTIKHTILVQIIILFKVCETLRAKFTCKASEGQDLESDELLID